MRVKVRKKERPLFLLLPLTEPIEVVEASIRNS
jgi:hypothetical protein